MTARFVAPPRSLPFQPWAGTSGSLPAGGSPRESCAWVGRSAAVFSRDREAHRSHVPFVHVSLRSPCVAVTLQWPLCEFALRFQSGAAPRWQYFMSDEQHLSVETSRLRLTAAHAHRAFFRPPLAPYLYHCLFALPTSRQPFPIPRRHPSNMSHIVNVVRAAPVTKVVEEAGSGPTAFTAGSVTTVPSLVTQF
eukprot:TRINITY_DN9607_c0_g1_i1.p1 TRINITY_DN9607_c0_g1~~TRINITY_DN9607_c0_g1_i1.p1  ORF type:complete len:193 (+),score=5.97 TRINITY_DN9607_c0_g1_i1:383-961(+)